MSGDEKISQLASGSPAQAGDEYVIARSGSNFKLTLTNIAATMPPIGASTPNSGAFTTLSASSTVSGTGFSTYLASPPAIGGTAAAAGSFTTLSASGVTTVQAGTSALPAVTTTGDTNTGVYFPAADQVAVTTGGTVAAAFNSNGLFFRNRIINGDMTIAQRGTSAGDNGTYPVDRWVYYAAQTSKGTFQQNSGSVTPPAGFQNYSGFVSSSAYSVVAADYFYLQQGVEGYNFADADWGTANAKTVTLSFWVRSSLTGTFGGSLRNEAVNRSYPYTYAISAANTWEYKTITIAGDTTGTWNKTTSNGVRVMFSVGAGTSQSGTAGAWAAANYSSATGAVSVVGTNGATWYITGVQLETGSVATPFERRPYGTELGLCQRYFVSMGGSSVYEQFFMVSSTAATDGRVVMFAPVEMRTRPSIIQSGSFELRGGSTALSGTYSASTTMYATAESSFCGVKNIGFDFYPGTAGSYGVTNAGCFVVRANNSTATRFQLSAEL